jgi:hypothetical protein
MPDHTMKFWRIFVLGWVIAAAVVAGRTQDLRLSQRLTSPERTEAGLEKLSSDQLAVLDALIRRDEKLPENLDATQLPATRFSQRLSAEERRTAGLDALVSRDESGALPALTARSTGAAAAPEFKRPALEIHGVISFTYGAGSGGYRETGGSVVLEYDDPAHHFSLLVGYAETHVSGAFLGRGCDGGAWHSHPIDTLPAPVQ